MLFLWHEFDKAGKIRAEEMVGKVLSFKLGNIDDISRKMWWEEGSQSEEEQSMKLRQVVYANPCSVRPVKQRRVGCFEIFGHFQTGYLIQQRSAVRNGSSVVEFAKGCFQKRLSKHDLRQQNALTFYLYKQASELRKQQIITGSFLWSTGSFRVQLLQMALKHAKETNSNTA
ncbi:hypothetical protein T03_13152 [Trichinella britovi]|uniref:Uncharacterized protein n=1 Tax=Trichinella britovi TaxID=45882 RepID=A0A0V1CX03_TRIBR|nr:hypothetical protein T09_3562 [Trichinella sp. T9]KRY53841.1 hypothetical protein T03_13152 [Trichinella britovi]